MWDLEGLGTSGRMPMSPRAASWMQPRPSSGMGMGVGMGTGVGAGVAAAASTSARDESDDDDEDGATDITGTDTTEATSQGSLTSVD